MKKIKFLSKAMTLIFTISLLCSAKTGVFATNGLTESELFDLKSFDIVDSVGNEELLLDNNITRAEFAKVIAKLLKLDSDSAGFGGNINYTDVPKTHWAYNYIELVSSLGYVKGDGMGHFFPEENITFNEAVKIMVSVLGYADEAEKVGGYPGGYLAMGANSNLLKNLSAAGDKKIERWVAFKLVYNSLDANRLVNLNYGSDVKLGISSQTLRDILMGDNDEGSSKFKGIVTANYDSWLINAISNIKENEVEIESILFDKGTTNAEEYLGQEVEVFVSISPDQTRPVIKQIRPTKFNEITEVSFKDLINFNKSGIEFQTSESRKTDKKYFTNSTVFLYNGRMVSDISTLDVLNMRDGSIRLFEDIARGTSTIHTVFINEYKSYTVENINPKDERIILKGDDRFNNLRYIELSEYKYGVTAYLMNTTGEKMNLDDIKKDDIITVYSSLDGMLLKVYVSDKMITGTINELNTSDSTISIDGEDYKYEKKVSVVDMIGKTVTVKLNYLGEIASIDIDNVSDSFGAIVKMHLGGGVGNKLEAQVLVPGRIMDDEEEDDDDPSSKAVPLIAAQNSKLLVLKFASRVAFNGERYTDTTQLKNAITSAMGAKQYLVVSYTVASDGLVRSIDTLKEYTFLQSTKQYNAYEKTFSGAGGAFGLDVKTAAFCIPTNIISSDDDYLARVEMTNRQNYYVSAYHYNKDTHCPEIVVFQAEMNYKTSGITSDVKKIGLIERVSSFLNVDGVEQKKVTMATPGGIMNYVISNDTASEADFASLKSGDLVRYSLDSKDQIDGFYYIESCDPIPGDYKRTVLNTLNIFSGVTVDAEYKVVSNNLNKWVDTVTVSGAGLITTTFDVQRTNPPPIYIWNSDKNKITIGTTDDFLLDQKHTIVLSDGLVRAVVIII